jgi:hypothetical protein
MTIQLHSIQPKPHPLAYACGWCHGGGYRGEKEPVCLNCKGKGWHIPKDVPAPTVPIADDQAPALLL